ncbi:MAG: cytochrome c biogenesis protein CcsA [Colwelliaceae bacterium]|nr:cytochrome c biogenesis protein CcsA [Colwelliaceae bacterium]
MEFSHFGALAAFICYFLATFAVVFRLFHPKGPHIVSVLTLGCLAIIIHTLNTANYLFNQEVINFSLPNVVSLVSLIITLTVTSLALRFKVNLLIPVTYAFAGLWQLIMVFMPQGNSAPIISGGFPVVSHVTLALIAYCVLVIATLFAFQVAYINMKLKSKNLAAVSHLPPLMQVETQLFILLFIGTACLTLSELTGFIFLENFISKDNAHKTVLSLLSLLCYITILWGHFKQGWRGHRVLVLTIVATSLLTLAYFGSRFVKEFLL